MYWIICMIKDHLLLLLLFLLLNYFILLVRKCSAWILAKELQQGVVLSMNTSKISLLYPDVLVHLGHRQFVYIVKSEKCVLPCDFPLFLNLNFLNIVQKMLIWFSAADNLDSSRVRLSVSPSL